KPEEGGIVLCIANPNALSGGHAQELQSRFEASAFVNAGGKHHQCVPIENHLPFERQLANHVADRPFMRLSCSDEDASDGQWRDAPLAQGFNERRRRWRGQGLRLTNRGLEEQPPIFRYDLVKDPQLWENRFEVLKLPSGDEKQLKTRLLQIFQGRQRG